MLLSLDSGVSALDQFQQDLDVIGNNIANVDTVGFKSANVEFADTLSQTIGSNSAGIEQVGTGVTTGSITDAFTQGSISSTGVASNLAINGNGFFVVQDPTTNDPYYTRDGDFTVNSSGFLVTSNGMEVLGTTTAGAGNPIQITPPSGSAAGVTVQSYTIGSDGTVTMDLSNGTTASAGQITLQNFTAPTQLSSVGDNLYSGTITGAGGLSAAVAPGASGTGSLVSGSLEMSNVDLATELTDLITAQRGFEANAQTVTTSNDILQDLVNLKH